MLLVVSTGAYYPPVDTTGVVDFSLPCTHSQVQQCTITEHIMLKMAKLEFENHKN